MHDSELLNEVVCAGAKNQILPNVDEKLEELNEQIVKSIENSEKGDDVNA